MTLQRFTTSWAPSGGSPWWLAAAAGPVLGLLALAAGIGLTSPRTNADVAEIGAHAGAQATDASPDASATNVVAKAAEDDDLDAALVERAPSRTCGAPVGVATDVPKPGSERWHVQRLHELAASDRAAFEREARDHFESKPSSEQFALLRVALADDAPLADEVGRALLEEGRRGDGDLLAATVALLERSSARSKNAAASALLASLTPEESRRFVGRSRGDSEANPSH